MPKNRGNKEIPLAILSRILAQSYVTLFLNYVGRVMHDCASILDSIAKGISLFPRFFTWCIPTSMFIQLNDFCTCSKYFSWLAYKCSSRKQSKLSKSLRIQAFESWKVFKMYMHYAIGASISSLHRESTDSL